jgi:hypothetical protein
LIDSQRLKKMLFLEELKKKEGIKLMEFDISKIWPLFCIPIVIFLGYIFSIKGSLKKRLQTFWKELI